MFYILASEPARLGKKARCYTVRRCAPRKLHGNNGQRNFSFGFWEVQPRGESSGVQIPPQISPRIELNGSHRPFSTDKNKKQKSDILNFLVVCFTICFFLYFSLQLSHFEVSLFFNISYFFSAFCFLSKFLGHRVLFSWNNISLGKNLLISTENLWFLRELWQKSMRSKRLLFADDSANIITRSLFTRPSPKDIKKSFQESFDGRGR